MECVFFCILLKKIKSIQHIKYLRIPYEYKRLKTLNNAMSGYQIKKNCPGAALMLTSGTGQLHDK